ncbi:MAG: pacearchaeosortase [Nanoarchaeota archaeon]|nr:pacearchaeosortase [Nanoarchaeota archaeon]
MHYYFSLIMRILTPFILSYELIQRITLFLTTNLSYLILKLINQNTFLIDDTLIYNETYIKFIPACAAASAYFLLLLLVVLTKDIKLKKRLKIFLLGSFIILLVNLFRITILTLILDNFSYNLFKTIHMFFWSIIASILVAFIWIYFTKKYRIRSIPVYSDLKYLLK